MNSQFTIFPAYSILHTSKVGGGGGGGGSIVIVLYLWL